jgi:hemerythrin-like metal-binding protein
MHNEGMTMKPYIVWKDFYSVSHPALDAEHRQIIETINDLYVAMNGPTDSTAKKRALERLVQYTQTHFANEEKIMQEAGYPDLAAHKVSHDGMKKQTLGLRTHLTSVTAKDVLVFLKKWWLDHIQGEDKNYAPYVELSTAGTSK